MANIHCPYCDRDFEIPELKEEMMKHKSDCAIHNEPAYQRGFCDCGTDIIDEARGFLRGLIGDCLDDLVNGKCTQDEFIEMLTEEILILRGNNFSMRVNKTGGS